jgi:hypothetical protein
MKYHAGVITKSGEVLGHAFESKEEAEEWILSIMETIKIAKIKNLITGEEEKIEF